MKKILLATLLFMVGITSVSAIKSDDEKKLDANIKDVTVFLSGAQVNRSGSVYLQSGITKIVIEGVSQYVDANTLQAKGIGDFTIMDVIFESHYPQPDNPVIHVEEMPKETKRQINYLRDSIADYKLQLDELKATMEVYSMERNMLLNNGTVKGSGKVNDSIPLLKDAMEFFRKKMTEINLALFKFKKREGDYRTELARMDVRMKQLENWRQHNQLVENVPVGPIYRIVATVNADKPVQARLNVAYIVSQAGWTPSYDLRAKSMNAPIELSYKAVVKQSTGVKWNKVPLTLSTANPYSRQEKPVLSTWYLNYNQAYYNNRADQYAKDQAKSFEDAELSVAYNSAPTAAGGVAGYQTSKNQAARTSINYTSKVQNMISAEYKISLPYTIESNNKAHMVSVTTENLKAEYNLAVVPKMDKNAFLVANITDWEDLNLIPAQARIYYDGTFVGQSYIDPLAMEDTLQLAMGRDNGITAIRKKLKDKTKDKVVGDNKVTETHYEITIKNTHSYSVNVIVEDQVPVSNHQDIKVDVLETDKAELEEHTGFLKWRFKMRGGATQKMQFAYSVKYDKTKYLSLNY